MVEVTGPRLRPAFTERANPGTGSGKVAGLPLPIRARPSTYLAEERVGVGCGRRAVINLLQVQGV